MLRNARYRPKRSRVKKRSLWFKVLGLLVLLGMLFGVGFYCYLYVEIKQRFESRRWSVPSRVFSATVPLFPGQALAPGQLKKMLVERRYLEGAQEPLRAGEFKMGKNALSVHFREFRFPGHALPPQRVQFEFAQNTLMRIRGSQGDQAFLELEPLEIARLFGHERESRLLINIKQVPRHLVDAVVGIEDHRFYEHGGMDWRGIFRALWTDVMARRVVQGGSTITQQLVKNYFLESERSFKRKFLEASMALIIEGLYGKDEILEMYLNEIYMGQKGNVAIHGMGEAARYYYGRNVEDLTLAEAAALAGMIRAPNLYSPVANPESARERRNTVLKRMAELGKISPQDYEKARIEPLKVTGSQLPLSVAPYFVDYVRQQLQELYAPEVLASEGLNIYTTLQPEMALAAENAVTEGLRELEKEISGKSEPAVDRPLQAVLIAIQPKTGSVLALVGGRDYGESHFNRALLAQRQPGSAIKPFIYLSALDRFTLASRLSDDARRYSVGGDFWTPKNYSGRYRGNVSFRTALEDSLNAATVGLAMSVGLERIIATLRSLGIQSPLEALPSMPLGSFEVTPLELTGAYAALDNDGQKPYLLSLKEVVTEGGDIQERRNVDFATVTTPAKAFLITNVLEGVVTRGTARNLKRWGIDFPCAGKTGTTSDYRDSWFVGYTTDLLTLVWVGYDDNRSTHLSGSAGAARIWTKFMKAVSPWFHPQAFRIPPGVVQRVICPESQQLASPHCPEKRLEYFLAENAPSDYCVTHAGQW